MRCAQHHQSPFITAMGGGLDHLAVLVARTCPVPLEIRSLPCLMSSIVCTSPVLPIVKPSHNHAVTGTPHRSRDESGSTASRGRAEPTQTVVRGEITGSASGHVRTRRREAFPTSPRHPRARFWPHTNKAQRGAAPVPSHLGVSPLGPRKAPSRSHLSVCLV